MNTLSEQLCVECALCCNGVLFKDVVLQRGDEAEPLRATGLPVKMRWGKERFPQPCAALEGCRCRCYARRPMRCRDFECLLIKAVKRGDMTLEKALGMVRTALLRADRVRQLLRRLGDREEPRALSQRFKRVTRRLEVRELDEAEAEAYAELTLAVHDLNLLLGQAFYPG